MLKEFIFGIEALPYIQWELTKGMSLAGALYNKVGHFNGTTKAFLPETCELIERVRFIDGIFPEPADNTPVLEFISDFLGKSEKRIAVFENYFKDPDKYLDGADIKHFFFEKEVYEYLTHEDNSMEDIIEVYRGISHYPSIGVLSELPQYSILPNGEYVDKSLIDEISDNSKHILIGAYDEETKLIWTFGEAFM